MTIINIFKQTSTLPRKDQCIALNNFSRDVGSLNEKTVLEIGADWEGKVLQSIKEDFGAKECFGVNPEITFDRHENNYHLLSRNGAQTGLPDCSIDIVFGHALLEHVTNLKDVLSEIHRVLRPGGLAWLSGEPIWSSRLGHHLWVKKDGVKYTFTENNVIPDFAHLLWDESHLRRYLSFIKDEELRETIHKEVYHSEGINRFFLEDYINIISKSNLELKLFRKHRSPFLDRAKYFLYHWQTTIQLIVKLYPHDFVTNGITIMLRKK